MVVTLLITDVVYGQGCSQCKLLAEQGSSGTVDENTFGSNINYGILYLMVAPYLLIMFLFRNKIIGFFKKKFQKG